VAQFWRTLCIISGTYPKLKLNAQINLLYMQFFDKYIALMMTAITANGLFVSPLMPDLIRLPQHFGLRAYSGRFK